MELVRKGGDETGCSLPLRPTYPRVRPSVIPFSAALGPFEPFVSIFPHHARFTNVRLGLDHRLLGGLVVWRWSCMSCHGEFLVEQHGAVFCVDRACEPEVGFVVGDSTQLLGRGCQQFVDQGEEFLRASFLMLLFVYRAVRSPRNCSSSSASSCGFV